MVRAPTKTPDPKSVSTYLDYLKRRILGNTVVHQETMPPRPQRLAADLSHLPPEIGRILEAAGIPSLYAHQAEGIEKILNGQM